MSTLFRVADFFTQISYEEMNTFPLEEYMTDGQYVCMTEYKCAWDERNQLARDLKGYTVRNGGIVYRNLPNKCPHNSAALVETISMRPFGQCAADGSDTSKISYEYAILAVRYTVPNFDVTGEEEYDDQGDVLVSERFTGAAEFLTVKGTTLYWDEAQTEALTEDQNPGRIVSLVNYTYTRHKVLEADFPTEAFSLMGKVNDVDITSRRYPLTMAAGTLLYLSPELDRDITTDGVQAWKITFSFSYRPLGWNNFFKTADLDPQPIYDGSGNAVLPYAEADFSPIIL